MRILSVRHATGLSTGRAAYQTDISSLAERVCHACLHSARAEIGKAFTTHYYQTFDTARVNLQTLYTDQSMLTFENEQFMGMQSIMTKLTVRTHHRQLRLNDRRRPGAFSEADGPAPRRTCAPPPARRRCSSRPSSTKSPRATRSRRRLAGSS